MEFKSEKKLKKVSNVEKNFIYECQICYEDYDTEKHTPMIVCSNHHAACAQCVKSNLFKMEYNAYKNPTGRFMCSKCSQIIQKDDIREHNILKQVCTYIKIIRQKDQELRKDFYNHVGTMGMSLVAMREDYDVIDKNNLILKRENELLIQENCKLKDQFLKIIKVKGSFEELKKAAREVEDIKETLQIENAKLQSLKQEINKKNAQAKSVSDQILRQKQQFFAVQREITELREDIKNACKKNKQLIEQNQGAINLKQYLEQQINSLQNQKKKILQENDSKKRKVNDGLKLMQSYWQKVLKGDILPELTFNNNDGESMKMQKKQPKSEQKTKQNSISSPISSIEEKEKPKSRQKQQISLFDYSQKSIKNFQTFEREVTLINDKLSNFSHISFDQGFKLSTDSSFIIKINKLQSQQIMIGLMTEDCKNKKNIYERKGFYGIDGFNKSWCDGDCDKSSVYVKTGDRITVKYLKEINSVSFSKGGKKDPFVMKLPANIKSNTLYPVVLLIVEGDSFEVVEVK